MISQELRENINKKVRMYLDPNADEKRVDFFSPYYPTCKIMPSHFFEDRENWPFYYPGLADEDDIPEGTRIISAGEHFRRKAGGELIQMVNKGLPYLNPYKAFNSVGLDTSYYSDNDMVPPKDAIFSVALMCQLEIRTTERLLEAGGLELSRGQKRDWVVKECLRNEIYSMEDVNTLLADNDEPPMEYSWEICEKRDSLEKHEQEK